MNGSMSFGKLFCGADVVEAIVKDLKICPTRQAASNSFVMAFCSV